MGEWIVRGSVWLALICYPAGPLGIGLSNASGSRIARFVWTLGCTAFLVHVASAFDVFYGWSHVTALRETARQVAELTGRPSDLGLYLNYLFTAVWAVDAAWWWLDVSSYRRRSWIVPLLLHGFFLFMIFNATVVFEDGATRVLGSVVTVIGILGLWKSIRHLRSER